MKRKLFSCGKGVFVTNAAGGMEPQSAWRESVDALCSAVAEATGPGAQIRYRAYPPAEQVSLETPRMVGLDVSGPQGTVYMSISICPAADPAQLDKRDLPALDLRDLQSGAEVEFWMANECDTLCLAARLLIALDQAPGFVPESSFCPSTSAR